jgi:hypothetical protein
LKNCRPAYLADVNWPSGAALSDYLQLQRLHDRNQKAEERYQVSMTYNTSIIGRVLAGGSSRPVCTK